MSPRSLVVTRPLTGTIHTPSMPPHRPASPEEARARPALKGAGAVGFA